VHDLYLTEAGDVYSAQDPENQKALLKLLQKQNLRGEFKPIENGVELTISWGSELL
jgi:hypothetical protein